MGLSNMACRQIGTLRKLFVPFCICAGTTNFVQYLLFAQSYIPNYIINRPYTHHRNNTHCFLSADPW